MGRKKCNSCKYSNCTCDLTQIVKQLAAPTFTEDLYKFATENNLFSGTIQEFLVFMQGPQGDSIYEWAVKNGFTTLPKEEWYENFLGTMQYADDDWD